LLAIKRDDTLVAPVSFVPVKVTGNVVPSVPDAGDTTVRVTVDALGGTCAGPRAGVASGRVAFAGNS
jgi:hypothetical protein